MICDESDEFPGLSRTDKIANYNTFLDLKQVTEVSVETRYIGYHYWISLFNRLKIEYLRMIKSFPQCVPGICDDDKMQQWFWLKIRIAHLISVSNGQQLHKNNWSSSSNQLA